VTRNASRYVLSALCIGAAVLLRAAGSPRRRSRAAQQRPEGEPRSAPNKLEAAVARRTAQLAASEKRYELAMTASDQAFWGWDVHSDKADEWLPRQGKRRHWHREEAAVVARPRDQHRVALGR
jgi:hypothetical protein